MPKGYTHLTRDERCQIYALKKRGMSRAEIGRALGRDPGTIGREIRRNSGERDATVASGAIGSSRRRRRRIRAAIKLLRLHGK